jgi:hypothetical protein
VDAPDRKLDTLCIECLVPSQHVLIDAINKRAVEVEKKGRLRLLHDYETLQKGTNLKTSFVNQKARSARSTHSYDISLRK